MYGAYALTTPSSSPTNHDQLEGMPKRRSEVLCAGEGASLLPLSSYVKKANDGCNRVLKSCLQILFVAGFGLASHLGVLADIPSIGVGKKLYHVDGLEKGPDHKQRIQTQLRKRGDYFHLIGDSGMIWGAAVRTSAEATNPVYVSVGHKISLDTAVGLVLACSLKRVPEPVRQADLLSRKYLRKEKRTHK
ncbi:Endonuclease V [Geodia barretti]|uniref:Endonuclease V n=1 Tax=Geodia barretti TaxID=519541 RepID=A0AA35RFN4_GEOBA|nr:Endonuclease V [Geodia barretti]